MAALTANRVATANMASNPQYAPQKGSTTCYLGAIICLDSSGYGKPGVTGTGLIGVGRCVEYSANTGADGAVNVEYEEGTFGPFANGSTSIAVGDEGKPCYIVDDQTVHINDGSGTRSPAGRVHSVTSAGVFVIMSRSLAREIAESQIVSTGQAYTQTYSTADRTVANPTGVAIGATLTDSSGDSGTHDDTIADGATVTAPDAVTATAPGAGADGTTPSGAQWSAAVTDITMLRGRVNTIVTDIGVTNQNVSDLAQKVIELVTAVNALVADDLDNRRTITAIIDDLQTADIVD